jgi:hypothetical protein
MDINAMIKPLTLTAFLICSVPHAYAEVKTYKDQQYRYFESDGIPNHTTGNFPNRGNPNSISKQSHKYKVPLQPHKNNQPRDQRGAVGIALNGVPFEPGTAEFWNNDRSWNYEALSGSINLGLDMNNAHVQPTGSYHYHGIPTGIINKPLTHVGYAADGFPIFVSKSNQYKSGYQLKSGSRPSGSRGPGGNYDGTFTNDYTYVARSGDLDICNGKEVNGKYVYILTSDFPYVPRCLFGSSDPSFERKRPPQHGGSTGNRPPHPQGRPSFSR